MSVKPEYAGRSGNCPRCRSPFTVPMQSNTTPPGMQPQQQQVLAPPPQRAPANPTQPYYQQVQAPQQPQAQPQPMAHGSGGARLEVVHGPAALQGKSFPLGRGRTMVIGRDPGADLTIPSDRVSRRHCQLAPSNDGLYVLQDLGSSNGTLVNQVPIQGKKVLLGGEYIQTGDCLFRYCE